ncbi:hypothetical protein GX51_03910 [Blastomyces parvus]|uniref:Uncharacterized protein n=1 Tax=Blastomyces parvus TaxID=2060905 RepID=A0A2B7X3L2_9EURO|nr:hypothetical protein GX51_03910 [Blastomyces parvus]
MQAVDSFISVSNNVALIPIHPTTSTSRWPKKLFAHSSHLWDLESLHKYAHGPLHIQTVKYWSKIVKDCPHVSIFHETYVVPPGQWENIYTNSRPTGLGATSFAVRTAQGNGETEWMSPVVDASKGALRGMAGRIKSDYLKGYEEKQKEFWDQSFDVDYKKFAP